MQKLKELQALQGLNTPVEILTEIEDIEVEIEKLQSEWSNLDEPPLTEMEYVTPTIELIFNRVKQLEAQCYAQPNDADLRTDLGHHLYFLGEAKAAREQFLAVRQLKSGGRGIRRGWIIAV